MNFIKLSRAACLLKRNLYPLGVKKYSENWGCFWLLSGAPGPRKAQGKQPVPFCVCPLLCPRLSFGDDMLNCGTGADLLCGSDTTTRRMAA